MNQKLVLVGFLLLFATNFATAQTSLISSTNLFTSNTAELLNINDENWSFYVDKENNLFYIDFENINVNLSEVVLQNQDSDIVFKDDVLDLPVNTIYELDLSTFPEGQYFLELRSYTKTIEKIIAVK